MRQYQLAGQTGKTAEFSVKFFTLHFLAFSNVLVILFNLLLSTKVSLFPETDTFHSIVSTCAQIIAGLYGITAAGYTFFLSRIDALMATDTTLDHIVAGVKRKFKYLIWFITLNVLISLFISILLMYFPVPTKSEHAFFYRLFCNGFIVFTCYSIVLILYYSISVVDPNCLEKEAAKQKKRISRLSLPSGSTVEYIDLYDRIETLCNAMLPETVLSQIHENKGKHFEYTIALLQEQNMLPKSVLNDLIRVHRYYECTVNCRPLSVSKEMCLLAKQLHAFLAENI